jgi:hypothetical protein
VTEALTDDPQAGAKILDRLSRLPGGKRRLTFAALVSNDVRTMDGGIAFVVGANLTLNRADCGRAKEILRKGIAERDRLYRPYFAALEGAHA